MNPSRKRLTKKPPAFTGPRERLSQMLVRLRQLEGNPHYIAMGMGLGIFVSILPIIPLQTLVAVGLAYLFRGSKSAAALGTWLSNPLTIPLVYYANYKLGCLLLGYEATLNNITFDSFSQLMALGIDVTWAMLVGGALIGAVLGIMAYFITLRIFVTIRNRSCPWNPGTGPRQ
ncbi:DUF2062 domain-containing protein [Desulfosarcina cetonica]|uniref:DUF2062 domain-containing protein n=1 Tax=Desulfosarcina cetonica TaxID=90730 RepID=UPI0006D263E0|nr:DUF2062 domain-containing protein [Desulfosarcina cetonica]